MAGEPTQLPWDELQQTEAGIPWSALRAIAEAAPPDPDVVHRLFATYEQARKTLFAEPCAADLYVAAILALAAPRFDDAQKREIGRFLIEKLIEAGQDDDDFIADPLLAACGAMGPTVLPFLLDVLSSRRDIKDAWFWLWDLTMLAAETEDEALRDRTIRACVDLLEQVDRGEVSSGEGMPAGWTLARLRRTEHADLLDRVHARAEFFTLNEYRHILNLLHGQSDDMPKGFWECRVEDWLESRWKMAVKTLADDKPEDRDEEEPDPDLVRAKAIALRFAMSPAARSLPPEMFDRAEFIVRRIVGDSLERQDTDYMEWDEATLRELLLDILPPNLPADRQLLTMFAPVTEAFLYFLDEQRLLPNADALASAVRGWGDQIVARGMDPTRWNSIKRNTMAALEAGADVFDPEVRYAITARNTRELLDGFHNLIEPASSSPALTEPNRPQSAPARERAEEPPLPIREYVPKVPRNASCPCGSGRKYKKCCGRSKPQVESDV